MGLSWVKRLLGPDQGRLVSLGGTVKAILKRSTWGTVKPDSSGVDAGTAVATEAPVSPGVVAPGVSGTTGCCVFSGSGADDPQAITNARIRSSGVNNNTLVFLNR